MDKEDFDRALAQLSAAADLIAAGISGPEKMSALQMRAFFRLQQARAQESIERHTVDQALFKSIASTALTMAVQELYMTAFALLEEARSLLLT
jgi:hypothetical protein